MKILVTGGAGYIGSVAVKKLLDSNNQVLVIDNLKKGKISLVDKRAKFIKLDLTDKKSLLKATKNIDAIMHFAAYKAVEESMKNPEKYDDNIIGTINLLECMVANNIEKIIFSSTAAVYGMPKKSEITEKTKTEPISYYGFTKLECENLIKWYSKIKGIEYICLRYFNVAGDSGLNYIDPEAENIMPILMEVLTGKRKNLTVFGTDYKTRDGTCIRDYIDVSDLVDAHILALNSKKANLVINLGTSKGVTVMELIKATELVTKKKLNCVLGNRRAGDPAAIIAKNNLAKNVLGWSPKKTLHEMIESTYKAYLNSNRNNKQD